MAAQTLTEINTPVAITCSSTTGNRRRVILPERPHLGLQLYHPTAILYYEPLDADDESAKGSAVETIPAGTLWSRRVSRGEFALSSDTADAAAEAQLVEGVGL